MARNCFPEIPLRFLQGPSRGYAAGQIRNVCRPVRFCPLENNGVFPAHSFASKPAHLHSKLGHWVVHFAAPPRQPIALTASNDFNLLGTQ
jgi:hypothetical protein